jgi:hypothetical protein
MSQFSSMTLTFNKGEHFHSVRVDAGHEPYAWESPINEDFSGGYVSHSGLWDVYCRFVRANYELVSCVIDGSSFEYEALKDLSNHSDVVDLFEALKEQTYDAHTICAWLTVDETANLSNLEGCCTAEGGNHSDLWNAVQDYEEGNVMVPSWISIDPEDTCDSYADYMGYELVDFEGYYYIFDLNY